MNVSLTQLFRFTAAICFSMIASTASAMICQFIPMSGQWNTAANWGGDCGGTVVPGSADRAEVSGGKTAILSAGVTTVGDVYLGGTVLQGAGRASTTLNVVAAGNIAWATGPTTFQDMTVVFTSTMAIPASNGPMSITNAELVLATPATALLADTITVTGTGSKISNNGVFRPSTSLTMLTGSSFDNNAGASFSPTGPVTVDGVFINKGELQVNPGSTVTLINAPAFSQPDPTGYIIGSGTLSGTGQTLTLGNGKVTGSPTLQFATVMNNGAVFAPGGFNNIGIITVTGNYFPGGPALLEIEFSRDAMMFLVFDLLVVNSNGTVWGGGITFTFINTGFGAPNAMSFATGSTYNVVAHAAASGFFGAFNAPIGRAVSLLYTASNVQIQFGPINLVTSPDNSGPGTLRQVITDLNVCTYPNLDVFFNFGMPGASIGVVTPLPTITCAMNIRGDTNPGASLNSSPNDWNAVLKVSLNQDASCTGCDGGLTVGAANVNIVGINFTNWNKGIRVLPGADNVVIVGNYFFQGIIGVSHEGGNSALIGDNANPSGRNIFVHATGAGVQSAYGGVLLPQIKNNLIGLGASAVPGLNAKGVHFIGTSGGSLQNNVIANNTKGIVVGAATTGVDYATSNKIFANGIGVDLSDDGLSGNDDTVFPYDTDNGGNLKLNFPIITSLTPTSGTSANVNFELKSSASSNFQVLFCRNPAGGAQCEEPVANTPIATNAAGIYTGTFGIGGLVPGTPVTLVAKAVSGPKMGNTSEISPGVNFAAGSPAISISGPTTFPNTTVGMNSSFQTISITNSGTSTLTLNSISHNNPGGFPDTTGGAAPNVTHWCGFGSTVGGAPNTGVPINLAPAASCMLNLIFAPTAPGPISGTVTIVSNAPTSPTMITLSGTGLAAPSPPTVLPLSLTFASAAQGTRSLPQAVTVTNNDTAPITLGAANATPAEFLITATTCGATLASMATCTLTMKLSPFPMSTPGGTSGGLSLMTSAGSLFVGLSGTIAAYTATATPSPTAFPTTAVLANSASQIVTFTNTSTGTISITAVDLTGPDVADFQVMSNTCVGIVASMATCTGTVRFSPQSLGAKAANLRFDSGGSSTLASLTGTSVVAAPVITSPSTAGGVTSTAFTYQITATNTPTSFGATGLPALLTVNSATGQITGTPSAAGTFNAVITATNAGGTGMQALTITVTAASVAPSITSAAPPGGTVGVGYTHNFTATGTTPFTWTLATGGFPPGVNVNASTGVLSGTPTAAGAFSFTVQVANGTAPNATQSGTITIAAAALPPTLALALSSPTTTLGNAVGLVLNISNPGAGALNAGAFTFTYPAGVVTATVPAITNTCGGTVTSVAGSTTLSAGGLAISPMGTCAIGVSVSSATAGGYTFTFPAGGLSASTGSNAGGSSAILTVTAVASPAVTLAPSAVNFGTRTVNTTSPASVVTLTNSGTANLIISSITGTGDFGFSSTCPISTPPITAGGTCAINITFTPLTVAALAGTISIVSNTPGSPHTIALSGTGSASAVPGIAIAPAALTFGAQTLNTTSAAQFITITNTGFANLSLSSITVATPFSRTTLSPTANPPDCASSLAPGSSCQVGVTFTASSIGTLSGFVSITDNAAGSPHTVTLTGTGTPIPVAVISLGSPVSFGDQIINSASGSRTVTISNTGTATLAISAITLTGTDAANFALSGQSGCISIAAAGNCNLTVIFTPTTTGAKTAQINLTSNAQNAATANSISLTGNGILAPRAIVNFSATAVGYGNVIFGGATPNQIIILTNSGGQAMTIPSIAVTGDFIQTNNCGSSLAPLATCTINILFTPLGQGMRFGEFILTSSSATSPDRIQLSGTGCRWFSQAQSRFFLTSCG